MYASNSNQPIPRKGILLDKLIVYHPVSKFHAQHGTPRLIIIFAVARHSTVVILNTITSVNILIQVFCSELLGFLDFVHRPVF
jgi:hypothetical protein